MSSCGPMHTVATSLCVPTTCSIAWTNSSANRPWVTRIIPIMPRKISRQMGPHEGREWASGRLANRSRLVRPFDHFGSARPQVAVQHSGRKPRFAPGLGNPVGGQRRAMPAAGAAEGDINVALALDGVAGKRFERQIADARKARGEGGVALDVLAHRCVETGETLEARLPVRVVEEAHVEHEIG